jgi:hypothetical protein
MPTWFRAVFNRTTIVLYVIGLVFLVLGLYLSPDFSPSVSWYDRALPLLNPLGYSLLITTLVASILNYSFQAAIQDRFAIIKGAEGAQIQRLYTNRMTALSAIGPESQRANRRMDILCISGTDLVQPNTEVLAEIGRRFRDRSGIKIRILLLDPRSRFAVERSVREEGQDYPPQNPQQFDYLNKKLCEDTLLAVRQLQTIIDESVSKNPAPFNISVRLYNSAPMMLYIALDDRVFIEQYHLGVPTSQSGIPFTRCLGKAIPLVEVPSASELGHTIDSHFEYLWRRFVTHELSVGSYDRIVSSLKSKDWLTEAMQVNMKDESELRT